MVLMNDCVIRVNDFYRGLKVQLHLTYCTCTPLRANVLHCAIRVNDFYRGLKVQLHLTYCILCTPKSKCASYIHIR